MPSKRLLKITAASVLLAASAGCATAPGDPYYSGGYAPTPVYGAGVIYDAPGYATYPAYPVVRRDNDRWEDMRNDRERQAWREREAKRKREQERVDRDARARRDMEHQRDQRRDWERQRDQDAAQREAARRDTAQREAAQRNAAQRDRERRERDLAQRQREERARASRNNRNSDGSPRTDYDRYNPKTGQFLPRSEDMP